ncbi:MAG: aspartate 1-decarboxylase [Candidatus Latescibacteria bacterium]|jgi:aspartate 1-decarboxylase|nr:aspartate 1-decarboxylase [Candidatus Latescibacterota bacterium]
MRTIWCSKLHGATVTETNLHYEGSITLDVALLAASGILPNERVQVVNVTNGNRLETYVIPGRQGEVCLNGPAARLTAVGDTVHVIAYCTVSDDEALQIAPVTVKLGSDNVVQETSRSLSAKSIWGIDAPHETQ